MSDTEECSSFSNSTIPVGTGMQYLTYKIFLPIYCTVGLTANIVLLTAFYRRSKIEKPYAYQVFQSVSKTLEVLSFGAFVTGMHLVSAVLSDGSNWFVKSYRLMFITCKIANPAYNHFITSTLLFSVAMSSDRTFALYFPFRYKYINHAKHQTVAALVCFLLPAIFSISFAWDFEIVNEGDLYQLNLDLAYKTGWFAVSSGWLSVAVRVIGVLCLALLNAAIVVKFRKQQRKVAKMTNRKEKEAVKKAADKTLFVLNIAQSVLVFCNQIPHVGIILLVFTVPSFLRCWGVTAPPMVDGCIMLTDSIDVLVIMAINKKLRKMVSSSIKCCKQTDVVSPAGSAPNQVNQGNQGNQGNQQGVIWANG